MANTPLHSGLLLAGGASSRFGAPKADARLAGLTLGQIALQRLAGSCDRIAIAGDVAHTAGDFTRLKDPADLARGPLGGILAGLEWARTNSIEWLCVSACDMPLLSRTIHVEQLQAAHMARAPVALATTESGPSPLCSVWSTSLASIVRERLMTGHPSIWRLAFELDAITTPIENEAMALNVNTPEDLERAAALTSYHWWAPAASDAPAQRNRSD